MASIPFVLCFLLILLLTVFAGVAAKRKVKESSDFTNASGSLTAGMVAGALVGGFVGGTSIVGTGVLAYSHGLASIWFTLGGGIAVILLGLFASRFRQLQVETLPELIGIQYGERAQLGSSLFLSLGMFIQVVAQILAALPRIQPVHERMAVAAVWGAPLFSLCWTWWLLRITGIDPLVVSGIWSAAALFIGWLSMKRSTRH